MRISDDVIASINQNGIDISSAWLWCSVDVYNVDYGDVLVQPISVEAATLNDCRFTASDGVLTIRQNQLSTSLVFWNGYVEFVEDPAAPGPSGVDVDDVSIGWNVDNELEVKDGGVTGDKVAAGTLTDDKLADMPAGTVKGRAAGSGTGPVVVLSTADLYAILGRGVAEGLASLGSDGKVPVAESQEHNALSGLQGGAPEDYQHLTAAQVASFAGKVDSVFGRTGDVVATSGDYTTTLVPEGTNLYWTSTRFSTAFAAKNTDSLTEGSTNLYCTNSRVDARITLQKGVAGGIATLDVGGKVPLSQLPATAIINTYVVASQAAMLALAAQQGDVAVRTDTHTSYILQAEPASSLANWIELLSPTDGVTSVGLSAPSIFTVSGSPITSSGTLSFAWNGTSSNFVRADGSVVATSSYLSAAGNPDLVAIEALDGTSGLLRKTAANTWSLDTATYLTGNQTITLSGVVTGSGTTSITTAIADGALSIAKTNGLQAALDSKQPLDADLTAISSLTSTGFARRTATDTWSVSALSWADISALAGTSSSSFCIGNDSRLSNSRTPTAHVLDGSLHTISGKTAGQVLLATSATTFAFTTLSGDATLSGAGALALASTAVTAGSYGSTTQVGTFTVDAKGRLTAAANASVAFPVTSVFGRTGAIVAASGDYTTAQVAESSNLYYTDARVRACVLAGYTAGSNTALAATDTILAAMGKIQGQINARLTGNQTITLSGVVTGSGATAITTSIADGALSIAKTSGLQGALDARMATASYPDLVAIEALDGTSGLLRKTAANTWSLDSSDYLTAPNVKEIYNWYSARPTDCNLAPNGHGGIRSFKATGVMTANKPPQGDSHIIHLGWDNTWGWESQIASRTGTGQLQVRGQSNGTWGAWRTVWDSENLPASTFSGLVNGSGSSGHVAYWSSASAQTGSANFSFDGVRQLTLGNASASTSTNPRFSILQHSGTAGGAEIFLGAAGAASIENSGKLILPGSRLLGMTTSELKLQRWSGSTWVTVFDYANSNPASLDVRFAGAVSLTGMASTTVRPVIVNADGTLLRDGNGTLMQRMTGYVAVRNKSRLTGEPYEFWDSDGVGWAPIQAGNIALKSLSGLRFPYIGSNTYLEAKTAPEMRTLLGVPSSTDAVIKNPSAEQKITSHALVVERSATNQAAFAAWIAGDTLGRVALRSDGAVEWGTGAAARDTNLYRAAENLLKTDDVFLAAGGFRSTGYQTGSIGGTGPGVEVHYDSTNSRARVLAYDRTAEARIPLAIDGSPINFCANGVLKGSFDASGNFNLVAGALQTAGVTRISSGGAGALTTLSTTGLATLNSLKNLATAGTGTRPKVALADGTDSAQDAATFRGTIGHYFETEAVNVILTYPGSNAGYFLLNNVAKKVIPVADLVEGLVVKIRCGFYLNAPEYSDFVFGLSRNTNNEYPLSYSSVKIGSGTTGAFPSLTSGYIRAELEIRLGAITSGTTRRVHYVTKLYEKNSNLSFFEDSTNYSLDVSQPLYPHAAIDLALSGSINRYYYEVEVLRP